MPQAGAGCTPAVPARRRLLGLSTLWLAGCGLGSGRDHDGPEAPSARPLQARPQVAWVFGSGGPRGFVHIGVIQALQQLKLQPDLIVGASAGAMAGTLCAAGLQAEALRRLALGTPPWTLLGWSPATPTKLDGGSLAQFVNRQVDGRPLQALPTAMVCAVQRLRDSAVIGFNHGDAGVAVQASSAIEGRFAPVRIRGELYADADLAMPLPVRLARQLGALRVLAVDASAHEERAPPGAESNREADLQRFFNLTPPSVNSMLVRLERCGFIRRVPGKARAIEVLVPAGHLPPLERPFKF